MDVSHEYFAQLGSANRCARSCLRSLVDFATLSLASALQRLALGNPAALEQIFRYLLGVIPDLEFKLFRSHLPEQAPAAERVIMTMAEQLEAKGRAEGEAKGRAEGLRRMLTHLLTLRFGPPPEDVHKRLETAHEEELLRWSERVLSAQSVVEVFTA